MNVVVCYVYVLVLWENSISFILTISVYCFRCFRWLWQDEDVTEHILGFTTYWILGDSDFKSCFGNRGFVNTFINKWFVLKNFNLLKFWDVTLFHSM